MPVSRAILISIGMKPCLSRVLWVTGGIATRMVCTPRSVNPAIARETAERGLAPIAASRCASPVRATPSPMRVLPAPASASPNACTTARSVAVAPAKFPAAMASWSNARWMTASASAAASLRPSGSPRSPAAHLGAHGLDGGGRGVGSGQAGDLVSGLDQFGDDGRADVAAGAGDEYTHEWLSRDGHPMSGAK